MYISVLISVIISAIVIFFIINGSRIKTETEPVRKVYWILNGVAIGIFMYVLNGSQVLNIICIAIVVMMFTLYSLIPSGFNENGISLRGMYFPYTKIENMKGEYIRNYYRLDFMAMNMQFYLQVKEENDDVLKACEYYYKKEKNK